MIYYYFYINKASYDVIESKPLNLFATTIFFKKHREMQQIPVT